MTNGCRRFAAFALQSVEENRLDKISRRDESRGVFVKKLKTEK